MSWFRKSNGHEKSEAVAQRDFPYTPDILKVQERAHYNLFVFDDMVPTLRMADKTGGDTDPVAWARTEEQYALYSCDKSPLIAIPQKDNFANTPTAAINGQIVRIKQSKLVELDERMENRVKFVSKRKTLVIKRYEMFDLEDDETAATLNVSPHDRGAAEVRYNSVHHRNGLISIPVVETVNAYIYLGIPEYWAPKPLVRTIKNNFREDVAVMILKDADMPRGYRDYRWSLDPIKPSSPRNESLRGSYFNVKTY